MPSPVRLRVYKGADGRWYWNATAGNNRVVGASEQGYRSRAYARWKARRAFPDGE